MIALLFLLEAGSFFVFDLYGCRHRSGLRFIHRAAAGMTGMAIVSIEAFLAGPADVAGLSACFLFPCGLLVIFPCSYERSSLSFATGVATGCAGVLMQAWSCLLPPGHSAFASQRTVCLSLVLLAGLAVYFAVAASRRFRGIRLFFRNPAVWHGIEDYSRFTYSQAFLFLWIMALCAYVVPGDAGLCLSALAAVLTLVLYAILYIRAMSGKTCLISPAAEGRIKDIIKGNLRTSCVDKADEDRRMNLLYGKIMSIMTEEKPYLDPSFSMNDLAMKAYSNKLYLSRTINLLSGRNFRQFLNYYRIQHAMALFRKDPKLKVSEAAGLSGFNSTVSFNMAFKINTGMTPTEWIQEHLAGQKERLASF